MDNLFYKSHKCWGSTFLTLFKKVLSEPTVMIANMFFSWNFLNHPKNRKCDHNIQKNDPITWGLI